MNDPSTRVSTRPRVANWKGKRETAALPAEKERYTFADVLTWGENERIEMINGEAIMMAPSSRIHQKVSMELSRQLANYLECFVKLALYRPAWVREYWIVEPETQTVQVYMLENGILQPCAFYGPEDVAKVNVLEGCFIELGQVFTE